MTDHTAQIGVIHTTGWAARLIQLVTGSRWNHAVIADAKGGCYSAEPGGVRWRPIDRYPDVIWSDFTLTHDQQLEILNWAFLHLHRPYAYLDDILIGIAKLTRTRTPAWITRRFETDDRLMCSELCTLAYGAAGIDLTLDAPAATVTPADLANLILKERT